MKTPFSPWPPYIVLIALCCAFALYIGIERPSRIHIGSLSFPATTNAVVRSLRGSAPVMATVVLDSGREADAEVGSGCLVQVGQRVMVLGDASEPAKLLVFPADMGALR